MTTPDLRRVTMLDAEPAFRTKTTQILEAAGAAVEIASTPEEFLEASTAGSFPDLLVIAIDRMTEKPDRYLEQLRDHAPAMRILIVTGFIRLEEAVRLLDHGADDLALKPIIWGHFRHTLIRLLSPSPLSPSLSPSLSLPSHSTLPSHPSPSPDPPPSPLPPHLPYAGVSPAEYATVLHPFATSTRLLLDGHLGELPTEVRTVLELLHGGLDWLDQIAREDLAADLGVDSATTPGPVSIHPLLEWVAEVFNPVAYMRSVEIATEPPPHPVETVLDPHGLTLILFGLVSRAVGQSRTGDEVRLSCSQDGEEVVIEVTDTAMAPDTDGEISPEDRTPDAAIAAARRRAEGMGATLRRAQVAGGKTVFRLAIPVTSVTHALGEGEAS